VDVRELVVAKEYAAYKDLYHRENTGQDNHLVEELLVDHVYRIHDGFLDDDDDNRKGEDKMVGCRADDGYSIPVVIVTLQKNLMKNNVDDEQ